MRLNVDRERRRKEKSRMEIKQQCTGWYPKECGNLEGWKLCKEQLNHLLNLPKDKRSEYLHSLSAEKENGNDAGM